MTVEPLRDAILAQAPEAWRENRHRQKSYDVHEDTQSLILVFCDDRWPELTVHKEAGWDRLSDVAVPVMHDIIDRFYAKGGTILRAMAANLKSGGRITPHQDTLPSFKYGHRIHVPITTNDKVRFTIEGLPYRLDVGHAYEINNLKVHSVMNRGNEDRITFIFDYMPRPAS